jgi:hypothetical protein
VIFKRSQKADLIAYIEQWWGRTDQALEVRRYEVGRNEGQQALLHCLIREIANQAGCGEDWFKQSFLKRDCEGLFPHWPSKHQKNRQGDIVLVPKSESDLTKREESEIIERLHGLAGEWGIELEEVHG